MVFGYARWNERVEDTKGSAADNALPATTPTPTSRSDGVTKLRISGDTLTLGAEMGDDRWWTIALEQIASPGRYELNQLGTSRIETAEGSPVTPILTRSKSAYEYAIFLRAAGLTETTWVGNIHGYEEQTGLQVRVDGRRVDPSVASIEYGDSITITRRSVFRPGSTPIATAETKYVMTEAGLRVRSTITWSKQAMIERAYVGMLPVDESLSEGRIGDSEVLDLTTGSGGAAGGKHVPSLRASVSNAEVTTSVQATPDSVDNWATSDRVDGLTYIEDREENLLNKVYMARVSPAGGPVTVNPGDTWTAQATYAASLN